MDYNQWCGLCANLEASSEVDENVKHTALSLYEITTISPDDFFMCSNCTNFVQEYINNFHKAQRVKDLFDELKTRDDLDSEEQLMSVREYYLSGDPVEVDTNIIIEKIEHIEEIITEEEITEEYTEYLEEDQELRDELITEGTSSDDIRKYSCDICSRSFKENRHLVAHKNVHLPEDQKSLFPCEKCGRNYSSVFSLRHHMKVVHINQAIFKCPHCEKTFSRKANLESHLNVHSTLKPFKCDICGLRLKTKGNLRVHKKIHSTDPNDLVSCNICTKQFKTSNQLTNHMITHSDLKKYSCEHCDVSYKRSKELQNHLLSVHFNIKKYSCPWCPKSFVNISNFRKHKKGMHKDELEKYEEMLRDEKDDDFIIEEIESKFF